MATQIPTAQLALSNEIVDSAQAWVRMCRPHLAHLVCIHLYPRIRGLGLRLDGIRWHHHQRMYSIMAIRTFSRGSSSFRKVQSFSGSFASGTCLAIPNVWLKVGPIPFVGKSMGGRWASHCCFCSKYVLRGTDSDGRACRVSLLYDMAHPSLEEWGSYPILPGDHQQAQYSSGCR